MRRILFFSDLHFPPPAGTIRTADLLHPKRLAGWLNLQFNRRRRHAYAGDAWQALVEFARRQKVDHLLFAGDAVNIGTAGELAAARDRFRELEALGIPLTWLAGNHDRYIPEKSPAWDRYFPGRGPEEADSKGLTRREICKGVQLFCLDSARPNPSIFRSSGRIPEEQLDDLAQALRDPSLSAQWLLIASHYSLCAADGRPEAASRALENGAELRALLRGLPRAVYLHGHIHRPFVIQRENWPLTVCAGSLSARRRESCWLLEVSVDSFRATPVRLVFEHLLAYPEEALNIRG